MRDANEQDLPMNGDRRIIRIDGLPDQAGIAAALRRAFAAGRQDDSDRDFAELLERLHQSQAQL